MPESLEDNANNLTDQASALYAGMSIDRASLADAELCVASCIRSYDNTWCTHPKSDSLKYSKQALSVPNV